MDVYLDDLVLLVGENNSGKTSFLEAFHLAVGSGRRILSGEDIFLDSGERKVPKNRKILIDLLFRPADDSGRVIDSFPEGSFWSQLWGNAINQDENDDSDFLAIRTEGKWDSKKAEYVVSRSFLNEWKEDSSLIEDAAVNQMAGSASNKQIEPIFLYLLDAKRDVQEELQTRGSFWNRLVAEPDLEEDTVKNLENTLSKVNDEIINNSDVLRHVEDHLQNLNNAIPEIEGKVQVSSVPRQLRDFRRGMDVNFATKGSQAFPMERYGMGTRSLGSILVFRAYMTWKQGLSSGNEVHPMLALEEPEAHLHPDAQRSLFRLIEKIPGQKIVSTHSPYVAGKGKLNQYRYFRRKHSESIISQIDEQIEEDVQYAIESAITRTRGDLLYARAVILVEGQSEEDSFPVFWEAFNGESPSLLGINVVRADGLRYKPFLRLFTMLGIPWYIFSDGEPQALKAVENALKEIGLEFPNENVTVIPDNKNLESYLVSENYIEPIVETIVKSEAVNEEHENALKKEWESKSSIELAKKLKCKKPEYAKPLAKRIVNLEDESKRIPILVRQLFEKVAEDLKL